jgi:thioesterase domain-containing protein/acyl carrier protein
VAYIASDSGTAVDIASLRVAIRKKLPEYMVPAAFVFLDRLPLTPNGKVDRKALPEPDERHADTRQFVAPSNELERKLAQIFARVLNIQRVGITDDFFDLGGHSLKAVSLAFAIERECGKVFPLATLFRAPTVQQLAAALRDHEPVEESQIVIIQNGSADHLPLFCFPGAGGHSFNFRALVGHMDSDLPIYGFNLRGLDGRGRPLTSVEEIAREFLADVRRIQPSGPYHLVGYSFGGWIAIEMARQLRGAGENVAALVLIDSWGKDYPKVLSPMRRVGVHAQNMMKLAWPQKVEYASARAANFSERLGRLFGTTTQHAARPALSGIIGDVQQATWQAMQGHIPRPYSGDALLIRALVVPDWPGSSFADASNGWSDLISSLRVVGMPCRHLEMFDAQMAPQLARHIESAIATWQLNHALP